MRFLLAITTFTALSFLACQQEGADDNTVTISGKIINPAGETVTVTTRGHLGEPVDLGEASLDSAGTFTMRFDLDAPVHATLGYGRETTAMYIQPGDDISLTLDPEAFDESITYAGTGAGINNYLAQKYLVEEQYQESLNPSNVYKMELDSFLQAINGLEATLKEHLRKSEEEADLPEEFVAQEEIAIQMDKANTLENYPRYHGYYTGKNDFEVDDSYYAFRDAIRLDDTGALNVPEFRSYLNGYVSRKLDAIVEKDTSLREDWPFAYRMTLDALKDDSTLPPTAKDYVMASEINKYMGYFGSDGVDTYMSWYRENSQNPEYLATVSETYDAWAEIGKGQPAPDFSYKSIDGEEVALADFAGKVVYVDVWATWCGPCKREIPHSKTLKEKYANNDEVVFLYVSVDEDKEAWRTFLENDPEFKGVHVITPDGWESEITQEYLINGIPRYILIDQESKIVSASAPRPSSGKVEGMIEELLANT